MGIADLPRAGRRARLRLLALLIGCEACVTDGHIAQLVLNILGHADGAGSLAPHRRARPA